MSARVAVVGATGYSGGELVALLHHHAGVELVATFGGTSKAAFERLHPSLRGQSGPDAQPWSIGALPDVEVVCLATPNETSAELAPQLLARGVRVLDLSGAFRLDAAQHAKWYGFSRPELDAVYSLPEVTDSGAVRTARLVANPGCFATSVVLALAPLRGFIGAGPIIADCKSGVSGAGKRSELGYSFTELHDDFKTYSTKGHRHAPEIERYARVNDLVFVPHLLPVARGILSTIYVQLEPGTAIERLDERYGEYRGVVRARRDVMPSLRDVVGTPRCEIGYQRLDGGRLLVVSVLDNLLKGAAGQAVQNLNLMLGLDELEGLG